MRGITGIRNVIGLIGLLALCQTVVVGQGARSTPVVGAFTQLRLVASLDQGSVLPLEPVPIALTAINETQRSVRGHLALDFSASHVIATVRQPDGTRVTAGRMSLGNVLTYISPVLIRPGQMRTVHEELLFDLDKLFREPGRHELRFEFSSVDRSGKIGSNPMVVRVATPQGADREAWDYIRASPVPGSFFGEALPDQLEQLVRTFGESRYAYHARLRLAQLDIAQGEYQQAIDWLTPVLDKGTPLLRRRAADLSRQAQAGLSSKRG